MKRSKEKKSWEELNEAATAKEDSGTINESTEMDASTSTPGPTHEANRGKGGNFSGGMPGQWEMSPMVSLDPTPVQGLTSPRRDLIPEVISAVRDEITIGFIVNNVPTEPELSPELEETTTVAIEYGKELEEEMLRQVERDSKRQGEAELRREEEEMLGRIVEKGERGEEGGEGGGKKTAEPEGVGSDSEKGIERSDWGEEGWREAGIQVTRTEDEPKLGGEAGEAAGSTTTKGAASGAKGGKEERKDQTTMDASKGPKQLENPILANAPKGPRVLP